ncbi:0e3970e5-52ce-4e7d-99d0-f9ace80c0107 [Sclerotinia trifoliorum]|uniref:0e3970e5-52ce-4e7d-99d0-f9ace80c0107 n=1 Tax=Sclerotinia trifoliorum TaxID=28548 RepID=A0A8H2ZSY1_9HELO|nr:0e3970e5-52ce-4e7d-99d0-f9ace80c0107 [Sclerotinia trifoliorum]
MEVPMEKLGLQNLLQESVFIKWVDEGHPYTLGSCLADNKENTNLIMKVVCDSERRLHVYFSLKVTHKHTGKDRSMEMLLVVPPHGDFECSLKVLPVSGLDDLSYHDALALHEAGISNLERIIVLPFDLHFTGFVVRKERESATILPSNSTSSTLMQKLRSLSVTKSFKVYIRPSDYAREHLKTVDELLRDKGVWIREPDMLKIYSQKGIMLVDWAQIKHQKVKGRPPPVPPHNAHDAQRSTEVPVPRSPSIADVDANVDVVPATPSLLPVCRSIFSPDCEEPSGVADDLDLDDICKDSGHVEPDLEVDSDEEYLAALNAQQLSQQLRQDASSEALRLEFKEWLKAATAINENVYEHSRLAKKLFALGESVHTSNSAMFDAIRPWCSALFLCDPTDSSRPTDEWFVSDMAELIKWINTFQRGAEMTMLINDFIKLGSAARVCNKDEYKRHKVDFLLRIWVEFDCSRISINGESRKVLSRKRNILKTGRNVSKRARTAA